MLQFYLPKKVPISFKKIVPSENDLKDYNLSSLLNVLSFNIHVQLDNMCRLNWITGRKTVK